MRIKGLDVLRGLAVILVLFRHSSLEGSLLQGFGWLGVDLFFVLSGFLVSGLVFEEYKTSNRFNLGRFLIRRGFKILPAFYFFLFSSMIFHRLYVGSFYNYNEMLSELFFLQSYLPQLWLHTWSLSVEVHFYLIFTLLFFIAIKSKILHHKKLVMAFLITALVSSFLMRLYTSYPHRDDELFGFVQTHLRSDGILVGVLISYLFHFSNAYKYFISRKLYFAFFGIALVLPGFYFGGGSFFMNTIGLTLVNLGFGIIVLLSLNFNLSSTSSIKKIIEVPIEILSFIGLHSYSIYIWHLKANSSVMKFVDVSSELAAAIYIVFVIILGVVLSYTIERPFISLRGLIMK